jgi:hypothetical protein
MWYRAYGLLEALRRTLSERPLERPVKGEKGLGIHLPHLAPYRGF